MLINEQWNAFHFIKTGKNRKPQGKTVVFIKTAKECLQVFDVLSGASSSADLPTHQGAHMPRRRFNQRGEKTIFILMVRRREGIELYSIPPGHIQNEILVLNIIHDIIPVFETGNKEDSGSYRPVSLTSVYSKIVE